MKEQDKRTIAVYPGTHAVIMRRRDDRLKTAADVVKHAVDFMIAIESNYASASHDPQLCEDSLERLIKSIADRHKRDESFTVAEIIGRKNVGVSVEPLSDTIQHSEEDPDAEQD